MIFKKLDFLQFTNDYELYFEKFHSLHNYKLYISCKAQYNKSFNSGCLKFKKINYDNLELNKTFLLVLKNFIQFNLNLMDIFIELKRYLITEKCDKISNAAKLPKTNFFFSYLKINSKIAYNNCLNKVFYKNSKLYNIYFIKYALTEQYFNNFNANLIISSDYSIITGLEHNNQLNVRISGFSYEALETVKIKFFKINTCFLIYNTLNKYVIEDFYTDGQDLYSNLSEVMQECSYHLQLELNNFSNI